MGMLVYNIKLKFQLTTCREYSIDIYLVFEDYSRLRLVKLATECVKFSISG